jgi:hypothetical protein
MHRFDPRTFYCMGALAAALALSTGCNKAPAPVSDTQITANIERQYAAESALASLPIRVQSVNGAVTLSGTVNNDAARELAAADAAQAAGVKTVINNLTVQPQPAAPASMPEPKPEPPAPRKVRHERKHAAQPAPEQAEATPPPPPVAPPVPPPPTEQAQPTPPPPPPPPVMEKVTIPAGTDLAVRIAETLETGKTQPGQRFHGVLASSVHINGVVAIPRGAEVVGRLIDAKDAGHFKGRAELSMELLQITVQGSPVPVVTQTVLQLGAARGKNTLEKSGGGAFLGGLIGALAGGGRGALIGAVAGAGTGAGANAITRGQQVQIPSESVLHFNLKSPMQVMALVQPGVSQPGTAPSAY